MVIKNNTKGTNVKINNKKLTEVLIENKVSEYIYSFLSCNIKKLYSVLHSIQIFFALGFIELLIHNFKQLV